VAAAVFELIGVLVGGIIAVSAAYFMERRRGWLEARAARLLTYEDVEYARAELRRSAPDFDAADRRSARPRTRGRPVAPRCCTGRARRGAASTRTTGSASAGSSTALGAVGSTPDPLVEADDAIDGILATLETFRDDRPPLPRVFRNIVTRPFHRGAKPVDADDN
jgi:hypothetical protein